MPHPSAIPLATTTWIDEIAKLVTEITGVKLGARQGAMLEARLLKRMTQLGYSTPDLYLDYVRNNLEAEVPKLVALLTTHHTFFFREFAHFQYLEEHGLTPLVMRLRQQGESTLRVWSAACSQGQEVYSLAMFLSHHMRRLAPEMKFEILGTDVDPESVAKAQNGVYRWQDLKPVPLTYLWNHWVRGTGEISDFAKAKASIKSHCRFELGNLTDLARQSVRDTFHIIFCRNVFIYFEPDLVKQVARDLLGRLDENGLLFIGLSESLISSGLPLVPVAPSVYTRQDSILAPNRGAALPGGRPAVSGTDAVATPARRYRVFCVDDSPTILTLLRRILEPEFEIVGTAGNGIEAAQKVGVLKPDLMTLDIHMPEQGGIEYLEKHFGSGHPPVVILSSVPREDSMQAMRCLELGARDYVEKPELADLESRADEIRTKIRTAIQTAAIAMTGVSEIDRSFHQTIRISSLESKIRLIFAGAADRGKLAFILRECSGIQPPTVVLMEGSVGLLPSFASTLSGVIKTPCEVLDGAPRSLENGRIYVGDFQQAFQDIAMKAAGKQASVLLLGTPTDVMVRALARFSPSEVILEDHGTDLNSVTRGSFQPTYFVPYTSMAYHSNKYLGRDRPIAPAENPAPLAIARKPQKK
jgi:chemotaxis protein methyltransferase CheR